MPQTLKERLISITARVRIWARRRLPPGFRLPIGLLLIVGGVFGFLPVLGFWMIPLGIAIAAVDIKPLWRALTERKKR